MHMLHGNGGPPWQRAGRVAGEGRLLQELHPVGKLRSAGWQLPAEVDDAYLLRVYDTRPDEAWLKEVAAEAAGGRQLPTLVVGGDFLTHPHLEDAAALHPTEMRRWGPPGEAPYRLLVPPRPHQAAWAQRCAAQMKMEAPGTELMWCAVVPRDRYIPGMGSASLLRLLPQAEPLLTSKDLQVDIKVIGERAPLWRVPAKGDVKVLPPPVWERAFLPVDRVLVMAVVRLAAGSRTPPSCRLLRGDLPVPKSDGLELLRLEYVLPPATKQGNAEKLLWGAVRKLAEAMQLPLPPGPRTLRQVVVQHGGVVALFAVPTSQAVEWLKGSGCGGLYLRPFWTAMTDSSIGRERFSLLWLRGQAERGPEIWKVFHRRDGVVGLLLTGRDIALRVTPAANVVELEAQLGLSLGNAGVRFRQATAGQRWWRLGPLTEAECWRALEMVRSMGLEPLRGELRHARMGRWRHAVYFSAVGSPTKTTLDDGSRSCSEAFLQESSPPPRPPPRSAAAGPSMMTGSALAPSSTWAGPRQAPPAGPPSAFAPPAPPAASQVQLPQFQAAPPPPHVASPPPSTSFPPLSDARLPPSRARGGSSSAPPSTGISGGSRRQRPGGTQSQSRRDPSPGYGELLRLIEELRLELRALRRENELLRLREVPPFAPAPGAAPAAFPQTPPRNELLRQAQVAAAGPGLSQASAVPPLPHLLAPMPRLSPPPLFLS